MEANPPFHKNSLCGRECPGSLQRRPRPEAFRDLPHQIELPALDRLDRLEAAEHLVGLVQPLANALSSIGLVFVRYSLVNDAFRMWRHGISRLQVVAAGLILTLMAVRGRGRPRLAGLTRSRLAPRGTRIRMNANNGPPVSEPRRWREVTRLLQDASAGEPGAPAALLPLVYDQLRAARAAQELRRSSPTRRSRRRPWSTRRTCGWWTPRTPQQWDGRGHFFAAAAEAMRRILVDNARRRARAKRGGDRRRVEPRRGRADRGRAAGRPVALDEALAALAERQPEKAQLVKLRYFAGLTIEEAAEALGISTSTADRHWAYARAWLFRRVRAPGESTGPNPG